jgi:hypothetical protein
MAKYKLRFADGTTLALDRAGLQTWVDRGKVDGDTAVQPPGAKTWSPLREFLAGEGSGGGGRPRAGGPPPEPSSLKLAPIDDDGPDPDAEMYDGEVGDSPFAIVWLWVKRLLVTLVLLVGLGTAAAWWPVWLPWVTENGVKLFTAIDNKVHPERANQLSPEAERERREKELHDAAVEQLPHLDSATIQRVMASSMVGTIEPVEVFGRSQEAVWRALASLGPTEAQEVRDLKAALQNALPAAEREGLREYERIRAQRPTLPSEDRQAMALTARAYRAMPDAEQRRLQAVWARLVRAGLAAPQATRGQ